MVEHDPYEPDAQHAGYDDLEAPALRRTRRRRRPRGVVHMALKLATIVVALAVGILGGGYVYLGQGPISLESMRPAIAESLQSRLRPGYRVALGPIAVSRGLHGVGIGFRGLAIRDSFGRLVVSAPGGHIGLDALALLGLQVKVRRLELDGLQLALRVGANGELSLSAGDADAAVIPLGPAPATPAANNVGALVASLAESMAGVDQPLDHVAILNGKLTVLTAGRDQPAVYDGLRLTFDRSGETASASLAAHGPSGDWRVAARAQAGLKRILSVEAHELSVDDFLRLDPHPPRFSFDSPISFDLTAQSSPSGALTALDAAFSIGAGRFDPHDPDGGAPPIAVDEATGKVTLDDKGRFVLQKFEVLAGATHVRLAGWLASPAPGDLLWRAHLQSADSLFAPARPNDPAAVLDNVDLDAHFDPASSTFATDKFVAHGPHLAGQFAFGLHLAKAGPELKMDLQGQGSLLEALRLWPSFVNPDARKWCEENIRGGQLASGSLKIDWDAAALAAVLAKHAPPADSVDGRFTLRGAAVDLLPGLPTTTGLDATGVITGRYFHVEAPHGIMELGGGRRLAGTNLSFTVPDTKPVARMPAKGAGHIDGGADALADLLMRDALKRYVGVALDPASIKGQFAGDLALDLTLGKGVQPEDQKFRVAGNLSGLTIDKFLGNAKLEQGALEVVADRSQLKMTGTGLVLGTQAKLDVTKVGQDVGALVLTGNLDEAARAKLGFNSGPRLRGPVTLKLKAPLDKSGADVEVDLAKATLDSLGGAPWKPAGRPGKATFQLKPAPEGVQVNNLVIDAGALAGRGSALFGPEGALKSLKLAPFRMGASDDLKLDIEGGPATKVILRGAALDARGVVKGLTSSEPGRDSQDLDLDVKVGAALGFNREQISGFELTGSRRAGAFTALDARGRFGQARFSARSGDSGVILIKSDDAGALARFLDVYGKLQGGVIELAVRESSDGARGSATIRRFSIRDEPSLRQLQQAAPARQNMARGSNSTFNSDPSPPVSFDKLTANFTRVGGRLDVRDGVVASASFGLTTQGFIDFAKDKVDFNGVFVPLQQFNNALGGIPLLGTLLTGGQNEGVFAINYRVTGQASNPALNFNPLSGMTPGILRKMFGAIDGTTPPPSQDDADSPASAYAPRQQSR